MAPEIIGYWIVNREITVIFFNRSGLRIMSQYLWVCLHFHCFCPFCAQPSTDCHKMKLRHPDWLCFHAFLSRSSFASVSGCDPRLSSLSARCQSFRYPAGWRGSQAQIASAVRSHFRRMEGGEENLRMKPPLGAPRPNNH